MPQWFKSKYTYTEALDDSQVGTRNQEFFKSKTKSETILVDAVSFTDAEARTYEEAGSLKDIAITAIARQRYADVFRYDEGEEWYEARVDFLTEDERTGKQKRSKSKMLVNATSNQQAGERIVELLKTSLDPFEVTHIDKTDILEVVEYSDDKKELRDAVGAFKGTLQTMADDGIKVSVKGANDEEWKPLN